MIRVFVAGEMKDFLTANGVRLCLSSPYHPAFNGETERAVRTFKEAIRIMKNEPGTQTEKLARLLLSYRTTLTPYNHWMSTTRNFNGAEIANEA